MTDEGRLAYRVVLGASLFGWFCNAPGFLRNFADAIAHPIAYDAFPGVLRNPWVALSAYAAPALVIPTLVHPSRAFMRAGAVVLALSALVACLHLETGTDATFVTTFWTSLWLLWLVFNAHRTTLRFAVHGRALAQCVVGLMYLGAATGKLTPEYTSGEAVYRLWFRDNSSWPYPTLFAAFGPETVRSIATAFSRVALGGELVLAAAPLLPTRFALGFGGAAMLAMMVAWNFHLASVVSCLFGLLVAAYLFDRRLRGSATSGSSALPR